MLDMMRDSAHDGQHVYRVLYAAMQIALHYPQADRDILIAACLLHDIGRGAQNEDASICHAHAGALMAYDYLLSRGWPEARAAHVKEAIRTHRYRDDREPLSLEAQILFDADKLDVTGVFGIARTLQYEGQHSEPLYRVDEKGEILDGHEENAKPSFLREYVYKLSRVEERLFTPEARAMARGRQAQMKQFYDQLLQSARSLNRDGRQALLQAMDGPEA